MSEQGPIDFDHLIDRVNGLMGFGRNIAESFVATLDETTAQGQIAGAVLAMHTADHQGAFEKVTQALTTHPEEPALLGLRAKLLHVLGKPSEAIQSAR